MANQNEPAQFSVGSVEGIPFTACTSGPDIIILGSNFSRVQQITVGSPITSLDCSTDVGKIAAAYDNKMVIYEPIPFIQPQQQEQDQPQPQPQPQPQQQQLNSAGLSRLDYKWIQTAVIESETSISVMSFNLEGTRLIAGGQILQLWAVEGGTKANNWKCVWRCKTASNIIYLKYSPDGTLFCSASKSDRLVKIWFETIQTAGQQRFRFIYIAHPAPVTCLEWRRTSKYTLRNGPANVLITSCKDNIARIWIQTLLPSIINPGLHFHLAGNIEAEFENSNESFLNEDEDGAPQFVLHWINNKEIHITRSIEFLLHDTLIRILRANNHASSSTNSPQSAGESCSGSENDTDELDDPNDDTITAESSKKLRHKLCRKMNKQRALAASGRRDPADIDDHHPNGRLGSNSANIISNGRTSPASPVEEFDKSLESLVKKWLLSADLLFSVNKSDGTLILWQVKYLDGEDTGIYRQVQIDKLIPLKSALPHYDATTMSLNVTAYSPSAYLDVKRAYLAVTNSSDLDAPEVLPANTDSVNSINQPNMCIKLTSIIRDSIQLQASNGKLRRHTNKTDATGIGDSVYEMKHSVSTNSMTETEPSTFIVTQHLSGILGLWKLNFDSTYPKVQSVDLVTRITGLPIDPSWLRDGILTVEYLENDSTLCTKWIPDDVGRRIMPNGVRVPFSPTQQKVNLYDFEKIKPSLICSLPSVDEDFASNQTQSHLMNNEESQTNLKDSFRVSQMASTINILPQYHPKQLIELLAFGKLQRVKAILNHLVNCLVMLETSQEKETDSVNPLPWRSRTLSIVAQTPPTFHDSFDIDNPSSTIQQQVVEEIELDYVEVTSIRPLALYSLLKADTEKSNAHDNKSSAHEEFSTSYESIMRARSQVDETLDEILGQSAIETLNKQKEKKRFATDALDKGSLTTFNPKKAEELTRVLTHTHLPGLSNIDQMHLLAVADAVALFDASPNDLNDLHDDDDSSHGGASAISTNIAIDSLDDRGLRFLTAMRQHIYLTRCLPMKQRNELKAFGIGNHNLVWAFHSETQDELISLIPCVQRNKPEWAELREFGIGWWVKKLEVLRKLIEKAAQSAYQARQDPLDAALFYLAMKKKTLVCALLRRVNCDKRLLKLFEQDFNDPVNRKKALKNAYALLGLHRFEHAAAFFILAGSIWDAVEVCINNLNDIQLAIILIRLHDNDTNLPDNLKKLLLYYPVRDHQDPFLRSMAFWKLGDYSSSVYTLLDSYDCSASVFNFYLFLKEQPLVSMHKSQDETIAEKERGLFFATAHAYLQASCPLLTLEVLSRPSELLDMSKVQRMKFFACLHILLNELNTIVSSVNREFKIKFFEWLQSSVSALKDICTYSGSDSNVGDSTWAKANEPILRSMLTYCNLHSATENSLTTVRLELLDLLKNISPVK